MMLREMARRGGYADAIGREDRPAGVEPGRVEIWVSPEQGQRIVAIAMDPDAVTSSELLQLGRRLRHFGSYSWVSLPAQGPAQRGRWPVISPSHPVSR